MKSAKLNFGNRAQAGQSGADGGTDDDAFGQGGINDALRTELVVEAPGGLEYAAHQSHIFTYDVNPAVAAHFLCQRCVDCVNVG